MLKRAFAALLIALLPATSWGQTTVLQGGSWVPGLAPMYSSSGGSQPVVQSSGAAGSGLGLKELNITARGNACNTAQSPVVCAGTGTGQLGTILQLQDAATSNAGGYHAFSFSPNDGTGALVAFNAYGGASALPLRFNVNGTYYSFPFVTGGIVGPNTTVVGHVATWNNTTGTLLADSGAAPLTIGGTNGQIEYNNSGALGGFTMAGDCTLSQPNITCTKVNGQTVNLGGTLTTAAAFTQAGAFATTLTSVGATNVTLPQSGTLATLAGSEALTNKTINGMTITSSTGTFTLTNGKTLSVANTLTFSGTDGSTLNVGTGGTLGTAAFTASSAYVPAGSQMTAYLGSDVNLNNASNYFPGPSVAQGSTGTWYACGTVTTLNTSGPDQFWAKLWDGSTVINSGGFSSSATNFGGAITLCGTLAAPAGNIRIDVRDPGSTNGVLKFNLTGTSKDSSIVAFRVQ